MAAKQEHVKKFIYELNGYFEVRTDYSGRGMYGNTCVSINVDRDTRLGDVLEAIFHLGAEYASDDCDAETQFAMEMILRSAQMDSMGLGEVIYFPTADTTGMEQNDSEGSYDDDDDPDGDRSEL